MNDELICPYCNVEVDRDELRRNNGMCPTCGYDMSGGEEEEWSEEEWDDWEEEEDLAIDDEEEEEEEERS